MNPQDNEETLHFKVVIAGAVSAGKSNLFVRYLKDEFHETMMNTIGNDLKNKKIKVGEKDVNLQLWDTCGDPRYRNIISSYFKCCHAVLIVYDITDSQTFEAIDELIKTVETYVPKEAVVFLVGNKCDLESKRQVSKEKAMSFAAEKEYAYFETSAKAAVNVNEIFENLAERLVRQCKPFDINGTFTLKNEKKQTDPREKVCCASY